MKFGENDNAIGVWSMASPSTAKPQVQSLYHPWVLYPRGLYQNWSFWSYGKVSLVYVYETL